MKYNSETKSKILKEYLKGENIPQLAQKFKVPIKTIESWQTREQWTKKRKNEFQKAFENIFDEYRHHIEASSRDALAAIAIICQIAKQEIEHLAEKHPTAPRGDEFRLQAESWGKLLLATCSGIKNVLPEFKLELGEKILIELQKKKVEI